MPSMRRAPKFEMLPKSLLVPILKTVDLEYSGFVFDLDCIHTMPAHFENGEKFDG